MERGEKISLIIYITGIIIFISSIATFFIYLDAILSFIGISIAFFISYIHPLISIILKIEKKHRDFLAIMPTIQRK